MRKKKKKKSRNAECPDRVNNSHLDDWAQFAQQNYVEQDMLPAVASYET